MYDYKIKNFALSMKGDAFLSSETINAANMQNCYNFFRHPAMSIEWQIATDTKIAVSIRDLICPVEQFIRRDAPNVYHMDAHRRTHSASRRARMFLNLPGACVGDLSPWPVPLERACLRTCVNCATRNAEG